MKMFNGDQKKPMSRLRILVLVEHYLPGYKAGGPLRTISNMVERLGDEFDFYIITRDRDAQDHVPYPDIKVGQWQNVGKAQVCYVPASTVRNPIALRRYIQQADCHVHYLNSYFATLSLVYLLLRRLRFIQRKPVIIAPRGEFSSGALKLKSSKKQIYIKIARSFRLYGLTLWQASSDYEELDIKAVYPDAEIHIAPDMLPKHDANLQEKRYKKRGSAKIIFLSRITPMKNLYTALDILKSVRGQIFFDIYGTVHDQAYWQLCLSLIEDMPNNIEVTYKGEIPHEQVLSTLSHYHLFFLPTLGENFGHAIVEALGAGCLALISDQTPWRQLEKKKIGWDIPLDHKHEFISAIEEVINMDNATFQSCSSLALEFCRDLVASDGNIQTNRQLFYKCLEIKK